MRLHHRLRRLLLVLPALLLSPPLIAAPAAAPAENLLSLGAGAVVIQAADHYGSIWEPWQLLDERPDTGWAQLKEGDKGPFPFVFELAGRSEISALGFSTAGVDTTGSDVRNVKVELADSAKGPWTPLWSGALKSQQDRQRIPVTAKAGRYLKLTIVDNYGSPSWTELMDVAAYGRPLTAIPPPRAAGRFDTSFGTFRIAQDGVAAAGCYDNAFGLINNGGFEGRVLRFTWSEKNDDGTPRGRGPAIFIFSDDGTRFSGYYWNEGGAGGAPAGVWNGKRQGSEPGACPHWKPSPKGSAGKDLAGQLKKDGRVRLYGILFDTDSDVIRAESKPTIEALIAAAKSDAAMKLLIEGHTDSSGGAAHNRDLSARRAAAVKAALVTGGVPAASLTTQGFGADKPVASNDTTTGRSQNRRVEVVRQ